MSDEEIWSSYNPPNNNNGNPVKFTNNIYSFHISPVYYGVMRWSHCVGQDLDQLKIN